VSHTVKALMFFVLSGYSIAGQNLVPNPSFECGEMECTVDQGFLNHYVCNWYTPNGGTTDVFATNIPNKGCWASMPQPVRGTNNGARYIGSQMPHTGVRFVGIIPYEGIVDTWLYNYNYREYIEVRLIEQMIPGETYCVEMFVSTAARVGYACNNLGFYFHEEGIVPHMDSVLHFQPQIVHHEIVNDSVNWVKISGTITPSSPFKYLTIGNFSRNNETSSIRLTNFEPTHERYAYYFIDDVSVIQLPKKKIKVSGDTVICKGGTTTLKAEGDFENITWISLDDTTKVIGSLSNIIVRPEKTATYRAQGKVCNLSARDVITVKVNPVPEVLLGKDTSICKNDSVFISAGNGFKEYTWQDNTKASFYYAKENGKYSVTVWNDYNCNSTDDIKVTIIETPKIEFGEDRWVCNEFNALRGVGKHNKYLWSTGATDSLIFPEYSGEYSVVARNQCGEGRDTIKVYSLRDVFIPNVITSNDDKKNDRFEIRITEGQSHALNADLTLGGHLRIFNQWGSEVFAVDNYKNDWPGVNHSLSAGTYYYTFNFNNCPTLKGWIHVIR
jgi:hypothetical protein